MISTSQDPDLGHFAAKVLGVSLAGDIYVPWWIPGLPLQVLQNVWIQPGPSTAFGSIDGVFCFSFRGVLCPLSSVFFLVKGLFRAMGAHRRWWPLSSWLQPQLMGSSGGISRALPSTECHPGAPSPEGEHHCCHMSLSCKGPWRIWHF